MELGNPITRKDFLKRKQKYNQSEKLKHFKNLPGIEDLKGPIYCPE